MRHLAVHATTLIWLAACTSQISPSPSLSSIPTATPVPTASIGGADWFGEVPGWELVDAPAVGQEFEDLANAAVAGLGFVQVQAAAEATPDNGACCSATVVAFVVGPDPGHTEADLFRAVVDGLHAGVAVDPQPACDGGAVSLLMGPRELILGPLFTGPPTIFLVADGPSIGSSRTIYSLLIGAGPGRCP